MIDDIQLSEIELKAALKFAEDERDIYRDIARTLHTSFQAFKLVAKGTSTSPQILEELANILYSRFDKLGIEYDIEFMDINFLDKKENDQKST